MEDYRVIVIMKATIIKYAFKYNSYKLLKIIMQRKKKLCLLKTTRQKWKHFKEMFVRTLYNHQLNSSSRLQTIIYRKFCKHSQIYSKK